MPKHERMAERCMCRNMVRRRPSNMPRRPFPILWRTCILVWGGSESNEQSLGFSTSEVESFPDILHVRFHVSFLLESFRVWTNGKHERSEVQRLLPRPSALTRRHTIEPTTASVGISYRRFRRWIPARCSPLAHVAYRQHCIVVPALTTLTPQWQTSVRAGKLTAIDDFNRSSGGTARCSE